MKQFLKQKDTKAFIASYPDLTVDGAAAIYLYTSETPLYHQLNQSLRDRNREALKAGFFPYMRLLFEAHNAMRRSQPRMLNRGVKKDLVGADPDSYTIGASVRHGLLRFMWIRLILTVARATRS
jgi:hypothetical protein|eukprot:COSAG01_NODE_1143_length_11532_cov_7.995977_6_plen_124_part_00